MESKIQISPSLLSDAELKEVSHGWGAEEWECYLQTLEVGLKESQDSTVDVSRLGLASNIFEYAARSCSEETTAFIEKLISTLTEKQQLVIRKIFFEGLSERQLSKIMLISRQGVFDLKKRAIRQLQNKAGKVLATFPIVEAQNSDNGKQGMVRESRREGEL